jgi:hypothetical protein
MRAAYHFIKKREGEGEGEEEGEGVELLKPQPTNKTPTPPDSLQEIACDRMKRPETPITKDHLAP